MKFYKTLILAVAVLSTLAAAAQRAQAAKKVEAKHVVAEVRLPTGWTSQDSLPGLTKTKVRIAAFTGTIKITKKDGTVVEVTSDGKTPAPTLNDGDQVTVVSGDATLTAGGNTASLKSGDAVSVSGNALTVVTGTVAVSNSKGTTQVAAGKSITSQPAASVPSNNQNHTSNNQNNTSNSNPQQEQQTNNVSASAP